MIGLKCLRATKQRKRLLEILAEEVLYLVKLSDPLARHILPSVRDKSTVLFLGLFRYAKELLRVVDGFRFGLRQKVVGKRYKWAQWKTENPS